MIAWLRTSLGQLRDERVSTLVLIGLVLVTSFVATAAPRGFEHVSDDALRADIAAATAATRSLQLIQTTRIDAASGSEPLRTAETTGQGLEAQVPAALESLVSGRSLVIQTARWRVPPPVKTDSEFWLRIQTGLTDHIRVTDGRLPTGHTEPIADASGFVPDVPGLQPRAFEAIVSDGAAQVMGLHVGDRVDLRLDSSDPLSRGFAAGIAAIDIVGTYAVLDPSDPFWFDDTSVVRPRPRPVGTNYEYQDAPAFLSPDAYPSLLAATALADTPLLYTWLLEADPVRLASSRADDLLAALRRMESVFPAAAISIGVQQGTRARSGLLGLLSSYDARWRSALAVLAVVAIGPVAAAGLAIGLILVGIGRRRRPSVSVVRRRGASTSQLIGAALAQGLLLSLPATLLGAGLATILVQGGAAESAAVAALLVVAGTTGLFVVANVPAALGPLRDTARDTLTARRSSARRIVLEGGVVALAILGVFLLRERGVLGGSTAGELSSADPFIAAVPLLAGVAVALIVVRLLPIPLAGLATVAAWRRDLVPVLGLRRMTRSGGAIPVLVVLLVIASFAAFSAAVLVHLDRAADAVAWQEVGAPFRVTPAVARLPSDLDGASLPGVEAATSVFQVPVGVNATSAQLLALDLTGYRAIVADGPLSDALPDAAVAGTSDGTSLAAVVSTGLTQGRNGLPIGSPFELVVAGHRLPFTAVAAIDTFPSLPAGAPFVIVDRGQVQAVIPDDPLPSTSLLIRAPDEDAVALRGALAGAAPGAVVVARAERTEALRASPVVVAVTIGVGVAAILTALFGALALAAALALAGAGQADEVAHLRTLGLSRRQGSALMAVEQGPVVLTAIVLGLLAGIGLFALLRPGLGLAAILGSGIAVPLAVGPTQLLVVGAGLVAVVAVGIAIGTMVQRRADAATAVRRGLE